MKKLIVLLAMLVTTNAWAVSVTTQGAWQHLGNSNVGDGAEAIARVEQPLLWDLSGGLEYAYHGPTHHNGYGAFSAHSLLGELLYYPRFNWKAKPYIVGGLGESWWSFARSQDTINRGIEVKLGSAFAQKVGIGFNYPLGHNWSLNAEWAYFHADVPKNSFYSVDGSPSIILGDDNRSGRTTVGQEETSLAVGLRYEF